jgi:hypothetical protein
MPGADSHSGLTQVAARLDRNDERVVFQRSSRHWDLLAVNSLGLITARS